MKKRKHFREGVRVLILVSPYFNYVGTIWRLWKDKKTVEVKLNDGIVTVLKNQVKLLE